jgi:hypothetical protein
MVYRRSYRKYSNRFYWLDRVEGTMGIDEIGLDKQNEFQHIHERNNVGRLRLIVQSTYFYSEWIIFHCDESH